MKHGLTRETHKLRSHEPYSTECAFDDVVILSEELAHSEVTENKLLLSIKHQIIRLDISMCKVLHFVTVV